MEKRKTSGLQSIAKVHAKSGKAKAAARPKAPKRSDDEKPPMNLDGRIKKTSVAFDVGMWHCAEDLAHALTRKQRETGRGKVTISKVFMAAFVDFYEKSLDEQLKSVRRHL